MHEFLTEKIQRGRRTIRNFWGQTHDHPAPGSACSTLTLAEAPEPTRKTLTPRVLLAKSFPYVIVALTVLFALAITQHLWKANLSYPLQAWGGDGTLSVYGTKALSEGHLLYNDRIGAPFGLDFSNFYQPDSVHIAIEAALATIFGNPILAVNIYLLSGFVLIALAAFYVLRQFELSMPTALLCSVLYAFIPSHLWGSYYHLDLSGYYLIPLVVLLALRIMYGDHWLPAACIRGGGLARRQYNSNRVGRFLCFALLLGLLMGGSGVYYALYSMLFVGAASVYAAFRPGRRRYSVVGFVCIAAICLSVAAGMLPVKIHNIKYGDAGRDIAQRPLSDTEVYSLKIADLYLPMPEHPIKALRAITKKFNDSFTTLNDNESKYSDLGFIGAIGFSALLLWPIVRRSYDADDRLLKYLLILTLVGVLFATTAGFGSLLSLLIIPSFRCNNRIIVFIAFFALFGSGIILEKLFRRLPFTSFGKLASFASVAVLLIFGLYDQGATRMRGNLPAIRAQYAAGDHFVKEIESQLPRGAMVLELPYESFPEGGGNYHLGSYDLLWPYIHSTDLRWSFPAMSGTPEDKWIQELSSEPVPELLRRAVWAGFRGIYIDRWGYPDAAAALESQLRADTHTNPIVSKNNYGRFSFFSLMSYAAALKRETPPQQWKKLTSEVNPHLIITFPSGAYGPEVAGTGEWRWCNRNGEIEILNTTGHSQTVDFTGRITTAFPTKSFVFFRDSKQVFKAVATSAGNDFDWHLALKRGVNQIEFHTNASRVPAPKDPRVMYFRMEYLRIR